MPSLRPTIILGLACLVLVLGAIPFGGLLGAVVALLAICAMRKTRSRRRLRVAIAVSTLAMLLGLAWVWVFVEPPRRVVPGEGPVVLAMLGHELAAEGAFVTGSLYPWAERREVVRASHLVERDGTYSLRIDGARDEALQVDSVGLFVVDHERGAELVPTTQGTVVAVSGATEPLLALSPTDVVRGSEPVRTWTLLFSRPLSARALLVLTARTTAFAEDAFARYLATMGQSMDPFMSWVTKETCSDACRREVWDDETGRLGIGLRVSVAGGASIAIAPVGARSARTLAVPIEVPAGEGPLRVLLSATPRFWEIAHATLAPDAETRSGLTLVPVRAELSHGAQRDDVRELVTSSDRRRAALHEGESLEVRFDAPALATDRARTIFIALRAHYRVPTGGRRFLNLPVIAAHRSGLVSLPRFAAGLESIVEKPSPESARPSSAALSTGE